jgi:hypothetical protein
MSKEPEKRYCSPALKTIDYPIMELRLRAIWYFVTGFLPSFHGTRMKFNSSLTEIKILSFDIAKLRRSSTRGFSVKIWEVLDKGSG